MEGNFLLLFLVFFPFVGALLCYGIGRKNKKLRDYAADGIVFVELLCFLGLFAGYARIGGQSFTWEGFCGLGLHLALDGFRVLYGTVAAFMWLMTTVFSGEYLAHYRNRNRYYFFILLTLGATMGVFLSADLFTTFIFFEIMSFTSYVWVAHDETKEALRAAGTYLAIAVIGGMVMLMGLFLLYHKLGTLMIGELWMAAIACSSPGNLYVAGACLLFGFGAKAGMFPLQVWLPKAHPVAPAPASALLSGILTKAGIFGILVVSCQIFWHNGIWGSLVLFLGVITMFGGALLALFSVNIKRTLACSSLSQIGFILVGTGMVCLLGDENGLAVRGALLHMVNHSLIKLILFMAAGVIYRNLHKLELNEIRGFGRKKPLLNLVFLTGALGLGGIPLFNGYVSKTLLHESIIEYTALLREGAATPLFFGVGSLQIIEWIFLISGGLTVAYMLKLYIAIFIEKNKDAKKQETFDALGRNYMKKESVFALGGSGLVVACLGIVPSITMDRLADLGQGFLYAPGAEAFLEMHKVAYFSLANIKGAAISILLGLLIYGVIVRKWMMKTDENGMRCYCNRWDERVDLENLLYRPMFLRVLPFIGTFISRVGDTLIDGTIVLLRKTLYKDSKIPHELEEGTPFTHFVGSMADHLAYYYRFIRRLGKEDKPEYQKDYEHRLAGFHDIISENNMIIGRSLSFGLFLFCVGFLLTVLYLLLD